MTHEETRSILIILPLVAVEDKEELLSARVDLGTFLVALLNSLSITLRL